MDRVFLDANVLFSAAYLPGSGVTRLWGVGADLITSAYALEEARRNLAEGEQRARLDALQESLTVVREAGTSPRLPPGIDLPQKDVPILLAAAAGGATHLVTGDVTHFGEYYGRVILGVTVLTPANYLKRRAAEPEG